LGLEDFRSHLALILTFGSTIANTEKAIHSYREATLWQILQEAMDRGLNLKQSAEQIFPADCHIP
jgi:hypothetical protein